MKRYKRKFIDNFEIDKDYIKKIKESSVSFTSADDARDAIANIIYFLGNKLGFDHPEFCIHVSYALYSGVLSNLEDIGETDDQLLQKKAQDILNKILQNVKKFVKV